MNMQIEEKPSDKKNAKKNIVLIIIVIAIAIIPLIFLNNTKFVGADDQAEAAISKINKNYKPWFNSIWTPPSGEIESLLFSLQAGIGSFVIGYYFGYSRSRKKQEDSE